MARTERHFLLSKKFLVLYTVQKIICWIQCFRRTKHVCQGRYYQGQVESTCAETSKSYTASWLSLCYCWRFLMCPSARMPSLLRLQSMTSSALGPCTRPASSRLPQSRSC